MKTVRFNTDTKLLRLAVACHLSTARLAHRSHKGARYASLCRGKARSLIAKTYPLNFEAIASEWETYATAPSAELIETYNPHA